MNLELRDPFAADIPERIETGLVEGHGTVAEFNRRGTLLAVGCQDGRIVIWDFDTRNVARVLEGHVHVITSLSWSRDGRTLLSASTDWKLCLWDVLSGSLLLAF